MDVIETKCNAFSVPREGEGKSKKNTKSSRKASTDKKTSSKKTVKKYKLNEKKKIWEIFNEDLTLIQDSQEKQIEEEEEEIYEPTNPIVLPEKVETPVSLFLSSIHTFNLPSRATANYFSSPLCSNEKMNIETKPKKMPVTNKDQCDGVICRLCKSVLIITEDGFPTCTSPTCGVIYRDTLDYSPEWRFYGGDDKNGNDTTRCGNPINPLLIESSFGCKIICGSRSSYEMKKMRKWTEWQSMPHKEKSLYEEFQFITTMAQNAGIPKIFIDDAMSIHKDISEQKMFRGLNRDGIKAASIYISCRLNGCPRTAHEISEIFFLDKISATAGCSTAVNILHNIERDLDPSLQTNLGLTTPSSFIDRYCSKLNMGEKSTILAKFVVLKVEKNNIISDNTPHAIAAGVVFFIAKNCNLNINKLDIKKVCGISEVTVNKCFKKLEAVKTQLLPNCVLHP